MYCKSSPASTRARTSSIRNHDSTALLSWPDLQLVGALIANGLTCLLAMGWIPGFGGKEKDSAGEFFLLSRVYAVRGAALRLAETTDI
jgi:hypothetical protein